MTGPALFSFNSATFFSTRDVEFKNRLETFKINDSAHGEAAERVSSVVAEADVQPEGRWSAAIIAALWPYANSVLGASVHGSADLPLVANAADGEIHTIKAAAVHKMPQVILSSVKTLVGPATFRGVRANASNWSDANSLIQVAGTGGSIVDATYDPGLIKTQAYTAAWGSLTGFGALDTEDGFILDFNLQLKPIGTDAYGVLDYRFVSLEAMVRCKPVGPTSANVLAAANYQGTGAKRGRDPRYQSDNSTLNPDLVITGADGINYVTLKCASIEQSGYRFGATTLRQGEIGFKANRVFTSGVQQPLFVLAAS